MKQDTYYPLKIWIIFLGIPILLLGCKAQKRPPIPTSTQAFFKPTASPVPINTIIPSATPTNTNAYTPPPSATPTDLPSITPTATPEPTKQFIEHFISQEIKTGSGLFIDDMDGDGDMDVVGGGSSQIIWWENTLLVPKTETALTTENCNNAGLSPLACTGISQNDDWTPIIQDFNGILMVLVPAGCFQMGIDNGFPETQPIHEICFDHPFWIDHTEVTVGQFVDFLNGQGQSIDNYDKWLNVWGVTFEPHIQLDHDNGSWYPLFEDENRPLENVTWFGAHDYCAWRNARLPSESEWEYAARGPQNLLYPWGNEFERDRIVRFEGRNPEVGSKPRGASWVGALDMSGSMFEWTNSLYMPYPYDPLDGREVSFDENEGDRVFRGSAWYHPERMDDDLRATARLDAPPDYAAWYYGFRCARSID